MNNEILKLTEKTFQDFLESNLKQMFVFETVDYEYQYYFPTHGKITGKCKVSGKYKLQA
jgi:hypothetical protein